MLRDDIFIFIYYIIPIGSLLISFIIWKIQSKKEKIEEPELFYPPDNLNSVELGVYFKRKINNHDILTLLLSLANKGYIKITESIESGEVKYLFTKLKDYSEKNRSEAVIYKALFNDMDFDNEDYFDEDVLDSKASDNFRSIELDKAIKKLSQAVTKVDFINTTAVDCLADKIYDMSSGPAQICINIFKLMAFIVLFFLPIFLYSDSDGFIYTTIIIGFMGILNFFLLRKYKKIIDNIFAKLLAAGFNIYFIIEVIPTTELFQIITSSTSFIIGFVIGLASFLGIVYFSCHIDKRTKDGYKMYVEINGFKHSLENISNDKINLMLSTDKMYFFNMLPYTYVLGISKNWFKKFELLSFKQPEWYVTDVVLDYQSFVKKIDSFINIIVNDIEKR